MLRACLTVCRDLEGEKSTLAAAVAARDETLAGAHRQVQELQQKLEAAQAELALLLSTAGKRGEELMRQHRDAAARSTALGEEMECNCTNGCCCCNTGAIGCRQGVAYKV